MEIRIVGKVLIKKSKGKRQLGTPRLTKYDDTIKSRLT